MCKPGSEGGRGGQPPRSTRPAKPPLGHGHGQAIGARMHGSAPWNIEETIVGLPRLLVLSLCSPDPPDLVAVTFSVQRWQGETVNSMIKRRLGSALRARKYWSPCCEIILRVIIHNVMIVRIRVFYRADSTTLRLVARLLGLGRMALSFRKGLGRNGLQTTWTAHTSKVLIHMHYISRRQRPNIRL